MAEAVALVVDDNPSNRLVLGTMLEALGVTALVAESGAQALALLPGAEVALVFLDIHMPDLDGFAIFTQLRALTDAPVFAVTADATPETQQRCAAMGFDGVILKPVTAALLTSALSRLA